MKYYISIKEAYRGLLTKRKKSPAKTIVGNQTTAYYKRFTYRMLFLLLLGSIILSCSGLATASTQVSTGVWMTVTAGDAPVDPFSIAADLVGDLFVTSGSDIYELVSGGSNWTKLPVSGCTPDSITVRGDDGNTEVYVTDSTHSVVRMIQQTNNTWGVWKNIGGVTPTQVWVPASITLYDIGEFHQGSRFPFRFQYNSGHWETVNTNNGELFGPLGLAVDQNGSVYVTNQGSLGFPFTYYEAVEKYSNGNWSIIGNEYNNLLCYVDSVAVDLSGCVYVTTQFSPGSGGTNRIVKWDGSNWSTVTGSGALSPSGIAIDIWGNIYVIDTSDKTVKELPAGGTQWKTLMSTNGSGAASGIAVDGSGNVYVTLITDAGTRVIKKLQAPATQLVWVTQPGNGKAGNPWTTPPAVALADAGGNAQIGDSTDTVTLTLNNANGATLAGATAKLVNGVATFTNLAVSRVGGGYTLTPSCSISGGLDAPASNVFSMASPSAPGVTGVSPAKGVGGTTVTVTGNNLMGASTVMFGSVAGTNLNVISNTQLTVTAPTEPAGQVPVTVTTPGGTSNAVNFIFDPPGAWVGTWTIFGIKPDNFKSAMGMAVDGSGNIYIADRDGGWVDKFSGGTWTGVMQCDSPTGVAVYGSDYYVAASGDFKIWKNGGIWHDFSTDPATDKWKSLSPSGVAVDKNGNVYVVGNGTSTGSCFVVKWDNSSQTWKDITNSGVSFKYPEGVAVDGAGNVYVADSNLTSIAKLPNGSTQWTTIGSGLNQPHGVAVDNSYNIFVADYGNNIVREWPVGGSDWVTVGSGLYHPWGVAADQNSNVYVTEIDPNSGNYAVAKHLPPFTQLVWLNQPGDSDAGQPIAGETASVFPALALEDAHGNVQTGDSTDTVTLTLGNANGATLGGTTTVTFFKGIAYFNNLTVSQPGNGYTLTPSLPSGLTGVTLNTSNSFNVGAAPAQPKAMTWAGGWGLPIGETSYGKSTFSYAGWVAVDQSSGKVYVTDTSSGTLNEWNGSNWSVKWTISGSCPQGVAVDGSGNYYVALNSNSQVLKNLTPIGDLNGIHPNGVAVDKNSKVYVTGDKNGTSYVLLWNGSTWSDITYNGGNFSYLRGVAVDGAGNVYVADSNLGVIKQLPAGTTQWRTIGSGFDMPWGVAVDGAGNVYVTASSYVYVLRAGGSAWNPMPQVIGGSNGVAVDQYGNVYVVNLSNAYKHQAPAAKLVWMTQPGGGTAGQTWGQPQQPVVALMDANNKLESNCTDAITLSLTNAGGVSLSGITAALSNGKATFNSLAIKQAGISYTLTASCLGLVSDPSSPFNITPGTASKLVVETSSSQKAGIPFDVMVTAEDQYGNTVTGYTGTVHFSTDNDSSALPQDYTFTTGDAGTHIFKGVTLNKVMTATNLTVADTGNSNITGSMPNIQVTAGPVDTAKSTVVAGVSSVPANGTDSSTITVTLLDACDNPVSGKAVSLAGQLDGGQPSHSVITAVYGTSRTDGTAVFTVTDAVSEKVTYIAKDTTDSVTITQQPSVVYTPIVTFNSQGGSPVASMSNLTSGSTISAPADPTKTGNIFRGWYKEPSCINAWNFSIDTVTGNITLYAKWQDTVDPLTFSLPEGDYNTSLTVSITCDIEGAKIYYTTGGSEPNQSSTLYNGTPIKIMATTTLKAMACYADLKPGTNTATYNIKSKITDYQPGNNDPQATPNKLLTAQNIEGDLSVQYNPATLWLGKGKTGKLSDLWFYYPQLFGNGDGQIKDGSKIVSAQLVLTIKGFKGNSYSPHKINLYQITDPDGKGTPYFGESGLRNGLDYQYRDHRPGMDIPWKKPSTAGSKDTTIGDLVNETALVDSYEVIPAFFSAAGYTRIRLDVTKSIAAWLKNDARQGWFLRGDQAENWNFDDGIEFYGVGDPSPANRPRLVVTFLSADDVYNEPTQVDQTNLTVSYPGSGQVRLGWQNPSGINGVLILRKTGVIPADPTDGTVVFDGVAASKLDQDLENGKIYYYAVFTYDNRRNYSPRSYIKAIPRQGTGMAPVSPLGLTVSLSGKTLSFNWTDNSNNEDSFIIEQQEVINGTGQGYKQAFTAGVNQNNLTVRIDDPNFSLKPDKTYQYRIKAVNVFGDSGYSLDSNEIATPDFPAAPEKLSWIIISAGRVNLSWTDIANNETGYRIDICKNDSGQTVIRSVDLPADAISYSVTGLQPGTEYLLKVVAYNTIGESAAWTEPIITSSDSKGGLL